MWGGAGLRPSICVPLKPVLSPVHLLALPSLGKLLLTCLISCSEAFEKGSLRLLILQLLRA